MIQGKSLPYKYWAKLVHTTIYLLNRNHTREVKGVTLEEAWFGRKTKVSHFKNFNPTYLV